jgi:hypothetical protein
VILSILMRRNSDFISLLKPDRVAAFEKQLVAGQSTLPLSEPIDGFLPYQPVPACRTGTPCSNPSHWFQLRFSSLDIPCRDRGDTTGWQRRLDPLSGFRWANPQLSSDSSLGVRS